MIARVKIYPVYNKNNHIAFASVCFDNKFIVHGFKIIAGKDKLYVKMPTKYDYKNNHYVEIAHPIDKDFNKYLETLIIKEYYNHLNIRRIDL